MDTLQLSSSRSSGSVCAVNRSGSLFAQHRAVRLAALGGAVAALGCGEPDGTRLPELEPRSVPPPTSLDYALVFDREQQYGTTANANFPVAKASQSITAWVKPARLDADEAFFTMRRGIESGTIFGFSQGRLTAWSVWGMRIFVQADTSVVPDTWYHVAHVQTLIDDPTDDYEQRLYLNGELVAEGTQPPQSRTPTSSWLGSFDGTSQQYAGCLDDLRLYARVLSPSEVEAEAAGEPVSSEALVAFWPFDEAPGTSLAYDRSGNGNHGTLGDGVEAFMPDRVPSDRGF